MLTNKKETEELAQWILQQAKQQGASDAEVAITVSKGFSITIRMGELEILEHTRDKHVSIVVYEGHKTGSVSSSDLAKNSLKEAITKACNIAKFTHEDSYNGLAEQKLLAFDYPELDLYHPWNITEQKAIQLALTCEKQTMSQNRRITNSEGATVNTTDNFYAYGNTHGFIGSYFSSRHTLSCSVVADDGHEMQREYDYTTARDPQDLEDTALLAKRLAERTISRLGARRISTRRCPVIFSKEMARSLFGNLVSAISGGALYRKTSFLVDHLNKKIFPEFVHIEECPHLLKAIGSAPFDGEGVKTSRKNLIHQGILKSYLLGSYSARKLDMRSTGNAGGAYNVIVHDTGINFKQLLQKMDTGLLVTEMIGQGINLLTGDYSRGAFGYWIEKGEIQYPVQEITVAGNLRDIFSNVLAIDNEVDLRGNIQTGSVLIGEMTVAGA